MKWFFIYRTLTAFTRLERKPKARGKTSCDPHYPLFSFVSSTTGNSIFFLAPCFVFFVLSVGFDFVLVFWKLFLETIGLSILRELQRNTFRQKSPRDRNCTEVRFFDIYFFTCSKTALCCCCCCCCCNTEFGEFTIRQLSIYIKYSWRNEVSVSVSVSATVSVSVTVTVTVSVSVFVTVSVSVLL